MDFKEQCEQFKEQCKEYLANHDHEAWLRKQPTNIVSTFKSEAVWDSDRTFNSSPCFGSNIPFNTTKG